MNTSPTRIAIAIVNSAERFLVGIRGEDSSLPGKAEFPGGKCRDDESPAECAVRECFEETGLPIQPLRLLDARTHVYEHGTLALEFWLCEPLPSANLQEEHQGFRWVKRADLEMLDFPEANQTVIALLAKESNGLQ